MKNKNIIQRWRHAGSLWMALMATMLLLPAGCISEEQPALQPETDGPIEVSLLIDTRQPQTKAADTDVSLIKELRVYVFNTSNELVGHYHNPSLSASGEAYYVPLRLSEGGNLSFYVIGNESGAGITTLNESTTRATLTTTVFNKSGITDITGQGFLMTGTTTQNITDTETVTVVECPLERNFSLVDVFFAKTGDFTATVNSITLSDYTTDDYIYDKPGNWNQSYSTEAAALLPAATEVTAIVSEEQKETPALYGAAMVSHPVLRNIYGSDDPDVAPTVEKKPRLTITYTVAGKENTTEVYLPIVNRNYRYNVYCLLKAAGMTLWLQVADWEDANNWEGGLDFSYPSYKNPVLPESGKEEDMTEPTMYFDGADSEKGAFCMQFEITGPEDVVWTPILPGAKGEDYAIKVYLGDELQSPDGGGYPKTTADHPFTIKVIPLKADNLTGSGSKVKFGITYKPKWLGETTKAYFLLINGEEGRPAWPSSGSEPELIEIKQIEPPTITN